MAHKGTALKRCCYGKLLWLLCLSILWLSACSSGGGADTSGTAAGANECDGRCVNAASFLSVADVELILAQATAEALAQNAAATIAVVDRLGNVLAVFRMSGADTEITIDGARNVSTGLDGLSYIPDTLAAISKAITAAYLSSEGNAFSSRTASQIVQQNFNPGEADQPGGPLFGVQFSNLPCSDLNMRFTAGTSAGPKRSPLGLSADPGGIPLYKEGTPVGGIGVIADGTYGLDLDAGDLDHNPDELIAVAGSFAYAAPVNRRASQITLEGKTLRFADIDFSDLNTLPAEAPTFSAINSVRGDLLSVTAYTDGAIIAGLALAQAGSGIIADNADYAELDAFVLADDLDANRFPPIAGTDGADALTVNEVRQLIRTALDVANRARSQIRKPTGSQARVTISVVDSNGVVLGIARTRDAPLFGSDVSLQKARTAAFFSGVNAAVDLSAAPNTIYLNQGSPTPSGVEIVIADYVSAVQNFLGLPGALTDGEFAFADRSGGNLSRPYFPDGQIGAINGPLSKPFAQWSPFSTGLQLDLAMNRIIEHVLFTLGAGPDAPQNCTAIARLANGLQIFPGSVPIYRGNTLVGGIGVSGDGVDQDDMIAFLGLHEAGNILGTINNAATDRRADNLTPMGIRLRYVQCPQAPFLNSDMQNVCNGK